MLKKAVVLSIFVETVINFFYNIFFTSPPPPKRKLLTNITQYLNV